MHNQDNTDFEKCLDRLAKWEEAHRPNQPPVSEYIYHWFDTVS
jgi:hypothetical protein